MAARREVGGRLSLGAIAPWCRRASDWTMSWTRYLLHDFWTAREFNKIDEERRARRRTSRRRTERLKAAREALEARVDELEQDLGEAVLLVRTLTDLCLEKGVLDPEDMFKKAEELDALDGVIDGRMGKPVDPDAPKT